MRHARRALVIFGALALVGLLPPAPAAAHAVLLASFPTDGSVLASPPSAVYLWFSGTVEPVGLAIVVFDPSGRQIERGQVHSNGLELSVAVHAAGPGTYVVLWRVVSLDTHPAAGRLTFSVLRASRIVGSLSTDAALGLQVLARWLHALGYALGFGVLAFNRLVLRPPAGEYTRVYERRLHRLVTLGLVLLVLAEPLALVGQTASLGTGTLFDGGVAGAALATGFGRVLAQRLGAAVLLWVLLGAIGEGSGTAARIALVVGLALALIDGAASHAIATTPVWLGVIGTALHVAAAGLWVGGVVALASVWRVIGSDGERGALVARFGRLAAASVALLGATGAIMAWQHLTGPSDLVTTVYGRTLVVKTLAALGAVLLAYAGTTARRGRRAPWLRGEATVLVGVLALAGLVTSIPTPA